MRAWAGEDIIYDGWKNWPCAAPSYITPSSGSTVKARTHGELPRHRDARSHCSTMGNHPSV
ncbi:hypothetical protein GQ55_4G255000 [Panicum hallii var. hallii]|uniref:Uncharacterized protein n=1 Tax=Panicum hallii var. hallii TaxID=1504633 RepID=A0A2T7E028_9POAL|nr:hypothetical protein GQ55_4G255000 [Panicum hallii var. hallii]